MQLLAAGLHGRAARGSVAPSKMACRPAVGGLIRITVLGHRLALEGQPKRCPFVDGSGRCPKELPPPLLSLAFPHLLMARRGEHASS